MRLNFTEEGGGQITVGGKKKCPSCGASGSGPYSRWVRNSRGKRYEPYWYFAHRKGSRLHWCYLGRESGKKLDNQQGKTSEQLSNKRRKSCRRCRHFTTLDGRPFCSKLQGFLAPEMVNQPHDCFEEKH